MSAAVFSIGEPETIRAKKLNALYALVSSSGGGSGVSSFNTRTGAVTLSSSDVTSALTYTPLSAAANLSDLASAATARANLGLATVAATGAYADLSGRPSLATIATSGSASDLSTGTIPAARFPALTGDVITSAGSVATTIAASAVTLAKMANVATATVFYRKTAGTGAPEVQTFATLKADLGLTGTNSGDQTITLTGDVTGSGTGSFATTLATVNSDVGTFGSSSSIPVITVNARGLVTAVSTATPTGGGGGWTLLATQTPTSGTATVTFSSINQTYSDLLFVLKGVTPSASTTIQVAFSHGGVTYTTALALGIASASALYGQYNLRGYRLDVQALDWMHATNSANVTSLTATGGNVVVRLLTGIDAVRFSWTAGNFSAGTIELYGR